MNYQALARTWRPKNFEDMVGQEHVVTALTNALEQNRLHHAYLFSGTRGVGKTTVARIFAKALNCEEGSSAHPCGKCKSCIEIDEGNHVDLIEVDAASRTKVEQTRELLDNVQYKPVSGRYKIYLIDEVHMFSNNSFNALLKTLEEPPEHVKFLLATTDPKKCPITVLSRCLQFNLHPLSIDRISNYLAQLLTSEQKAFDHSAVLNLAKAAQGSMRDALSLLEQVIVFLGDKISDQSVEQMLGAASRESVLQLLKFTSIGNASDAMDVIDKMSGSSVNFVDCVEEMSSLLHLLNLYCVTQRLDDQTLKVPFDELKSYLSLEEIQLYYQILLEGKRELELASSMKAGFEMLVLRIIAFRPQTSAKINEKPTNTRIKSQDSPVKSVERTKETGRQETTQTKAALEPEAQNIQVAETAQSVQQNYVNAKNWHEVVDKLQITAITKQLADNCSFHGFENGVLELNLPQSLSIFLNSSNMDKLEKALFNYSSLIKKVKITQFEMEQANSDSVSQTPAQIRKQEELNEKENLKNSLLADPVVTQLQQGFDARLIEDSVQAVNEQNNEENL